MEDWLMNCQPDELGEPIKQRIKSFRVEKYIIFRPNCRIPIGNSLECFIGVSLFPAVGNEGLHNKMKSKVKSARTTIRRVTKESAITVEEAECIKKLKHANVVTLLGTEQDSSYR